MTATATAAKYDAILDAEALLRIERALSAFAPSSKPDYLRTASESNLRRAQARLFAAIDDLTPAEATAFGAYRLTAR
jgi:hypothetical protein